MYRASFIFEASPNDASFRLLYRRPRATIYANAVLAAVVAYDCARLGDAAAIKTGRFIYTLRNRLQVGRETRQKNRLHFGKAVQTLNATLAADARLFKSAIRYGDVEDAAVL